MDGNRLQTETEARNAGLALGHANYVTLSDLKGYRSRKGKTMPDRLTPNDAGTIFEGAAVRTADELAVTVIRYAFEMGMPAVDVVGSSDFMNEFDVADKSAVEESDEEAIEWFGENLGDLANVAQEWLNGNVAPDGFSFVWDDGLVLRSDDEKE